MPALTALIVDDSTLVRNQLASEIQHVMKDCQVFESDGVMAASRFLSRFVPDLVFLDLNMPKINGIELLAHLDTLVYGHKPPVVVSISADMSPATLEALNRRGAYDLLPKPFASAAVAAVLGRVVEMTRLRRVLVVDDSATVRSVVKRIIEHSRFNLSVEEAATGDDALRLFKSRPYDLAFIDVEMPGIDGLEAAGEILERRDDVRVVLMSGRDDEARRRAGSHVGASFFLKKPFFAKDVDAVLHAIYGLADAAFVTAARPESFTGLDFDAAVAVGEPEPRSA
jgi:CheY-like chemotaxis protein